MGEKPVANALTLELEPVVRENLNRHVATEELWYAHDYVPFEQGENFAFLGGRDWDASSVTLPKPITDALEILLVTKDNIAGYHRELRNYLVVTREIDPAANEDVRVQHVMKGYRGDHYSQVETLVFMALLERTHAVFCRNLQAQIEEPVLKNLVGRIARDEERHEEFFANLVAHLVKFDRDETVAAIAKLAAALEPIGADIDAYQDKLQVVADAGIFDDAALKKVRSDRIIAWGLGEQPELTQFVTQ
jgi:acyl-[acyl-carrier-protein] desaturase